MRRQLAPASDRRLRSPAYYLLTIFLDWWWALTDGSADFRGGANARQDHKKFSGEATPWW
jgi:hypothetical protein